MKAIHLKYIEDFINDMITYPKEKKGRKAFPCLGSPCLEHIFPSLTVIICFVSHIYLVDSVSISILAVINSISPLITSSTFFSISLIHPIPVTWT